jgi:hypothetical protein
MADMNRIVVNSRVGDDGVLHLALPVGADEANQEVRVTVEPLRRETPPDGSDRGDARLFAELDELTEGPCTAWRDDRSQE